MTGTQVRVVPKGPVLVAGPVRIETPDGIVEVQAVGIGIMQGCAGADQMVARRRSGQGMANRRRQRSACYVWANSFSVMDQGSTAESRYRRWFPPGCSSLPPSR